jgi:hypothetical protein
MDARVEALSIEENEQRKMHFLHPGICQVNFTTDLQIFITLCRYMIGVPFYCTCSYF